MSVALEKLRIPHVNASWALGIVYVAVMAAVFTIGDYIHSRIPGRFQNITALELAGSRLRGEIAEAFNLDDQIQNYLPTAEPVRDVRLERRKRVEKSLQADVDTVAAALKDADGAAIVRELKDALVDYRAAAADAEDASIRVGRTTALGLRGDFARDAAALDAVFDDMAATGKIEKANFLAMRIAHERFFRGQLASSIAEGDAARQRLHADVRAARGLTAAERTRVEAAIDAYAATFNRLAPILMHRTAARQRLDNAFDGLIPIVDRVSRLVAEECDRLRDDALGISKGVSAIIAVIGLAAAGLFLWVAVPNSRRLADKEKSLREANIRLQDFAQTSSDIFWEIDGRGRITRIEGPTGKYARVYGAHMIGRKFSEFLEAYNAEFMSPVDLDALWRGGRAFKDLLFRGRLPASGEPIWYSFSGIPLFHDNGELNMYRCSARDVTASEQVRAAGEVFRRQLEAIVSHLPLAVYQYEQVGDVGRTTLATDNIERVIGVPLSQLDRNRTHSFIHPDDRERFTKEIVAGLLNGGVGVSRGRVEVNGETRWIQETSRLMSGSIEGTLDTPATFVIEGMWLDVTDDVRKTRRINDFMSAIDSSADYFMIADAETHRIEFCNAGYQRLLGLPEDQPLPELYLGASGRPANWDLKSFLATLTQEARATGRWVGEQEWILHNGKRQIQFVRVSLLSGDRLLIALTDVTAERTRAREMENITIALAASTDGILTFRPETNGILYANPAVNRIIGAPEGENLSGKPLGDYITPVNASLTDLRKLVVDAAARGQVVTRRRDFVRNDGTNLTLLSRASGLADGTILLVMTDITDVARLERELADRRDELDRLIRNLPGVAYRLRFGPEGYVSDYASDRLALISGYSAAELAALTRSDRLLVDPEAVAMRRRKLDTSRVTGQPYEITWAMRCKDGSIRWMYETGNHFTQADGVITAQGYTADITDRVRYEEELKRSREENATIVRALNSAHEAVAIADTKGQITYANTAFEKLLDIYCGPGALADRLKEFSQRQGPVWVELMFEVIDTTKRDGYWTGELTVKTKSNESKRVRVFATRGESDQIIFLASDVTEESALRDTQELQTNILTALSTDQSMSWSDLESAAEQITAAAQRGLSSNLASLWLLKPDGRYLERIGRIGATNRDVPDDGVLDVQEYLPYWEILTRERIVVIEDTWQPGVARLRPYVEFPGVRGALLDVPVMRAGQIVGVLSCRHNEGPRVWTLADKRFAVHLSDFAALAIETSEREQAITQLRNANDKLLSVVTALDSTLDRIAIEGPDGRISYVNRPLAEALNGGRTEGLIGEPFLDVIAPVVENADETRHVIRTELDRANMWSGELKVRSPRGRRHLDVRVSRLRDGGVLYAATDRTEKYERDKEEAELKRQLADAQRMESIGRLAGGIAHDFNNILGAARGFADLISNELPAGSTPQIYASRIVSTCQRASELVREIMTFSRATQGERQPVMIKDILGEGMSIMADMLPGEMQLTCMNGAGTAAIEANPSQMIQILTNLTLNSRDAIERPDGRIAIRAERFRLSADRMDDMAVGYREEPVDGGRPLLRLVEGVLKADHDYVRLSVEDNGAGMSKSTLQKIFEPFFTTKGQLRGTGLGVPTVASIVTAHRGAIRISTRQGYGTSFDVFIPVTDKEAEKVVETKSSNNVTGRERVLIVDDEVDLADAMSLGLQRLGYEAVPLYDPREALQIFTEAPDAWDVVITDQVMPHMRGLRLISKLKEVRPDIKVILYTGHIENATPDDVKKAGAELFLYKPVTAEELAGAVRSLFPA